MPVICLCENNALPTRSVKAPFAEGICVFYVPVQKLKARHLRYLKHRLSDVSCVYFCDTYELLPCKSADEAAFYRHMLVDLTHAFYQGDSPCLFNASLSEARAMLKAFPLLSLSGEGALKISGELYCETGAAVFVSSGNCKTFCLYAEGEGGNLSLAAAARQCLFTPRGVYAPISRYLKRPLSLSEAARLYAYDQSASFIIETI